MNKEKGFLALSPLLVLMAFIVMFTIYSVDKAASAPNLSLTVAFMMASIYAVIISGNIPMKKRIDTFSKGAGASNLMLMLWIYVLAGSFAASAKGMGAIDATVNFALHYLPSNLLMPGLFLAACFISLSIGTSVGTVVALVPIASGIANSIGFSTPLMVAVIVGGAYFGDNLSFISDTTVVATQTQGCNMKDKFRVNAMIVAPAAMIVLAVYAVLGAHTPAPHATPPYRLPQDSALFAGAHHGHRRAQRHGSAHHRFGAVRHHRSMRGRLHPLRLVCHHRRWRAVDGRIDHHCHDGRRHVGNHTREWRH